MFSYKFMLKTTIAPKGRAVAACAMQFLPSVGPLLQRDA